MLTVGGGVPGFVLPPFALLVPLQLVSAARDRMRKNNCSRAILCASFWRRRSVWPRAARIFTKTIFIRVATGSRSALLVFLSARKPNQSPSATSARNFSRIEALERQGRRNGNGTLKWSAHQSIGQASVDVI